VPVAPLGVAFPLTFPTRSMVIDTGERKLYYVLPDKKAYAYPISVGREGFDWTGTETINQKQAWSDRYPPTEMRERDRASFPSGNMPALI
jgi:lipoprotein-anchoring transpeptidase ErfK/SrfK